MKKETARSKKGPVRKKNICVLPWIGREVRADGSLSVCCICDMYFKGGSGQKIQITNLTSAPALESNNELNKLKKEFIEGRKPKACQACWKLEAAKGVSRRQKMNREHYDKLRKIEKDPLVELEKTVFDFKVGNICNQKCLICGPAASSLWIKEHRELYSSNDYLKTKNISQKTLPTLQNFLTGAQEVHISGGEPFLNVDDLEKLLTRSIDSGVAGKQRLIITTNGSVFPETLVREVFPRFGKVQILMSADGIGPQFDYLRHPGKWDNFFENYLRFKKTEFFAGICLTINALNAFNVGDYLQFWDGRGEDKLLVNYLNSPEVLAVDALPTQIQKKIGRRWLEQKYVNPRSELLMFELSQYLRLSSNSISQKNLLSLRESILKHDGYRRLSFSHVFKEYDQLLNETVF